MGTPHEYSAEPPVCTSLCRYRCTHVCVYVYNMNLFIFSSIFFFIKQFFTVFSVLGRHYFEFLWLAILVFSMRTEAQPTQKVSIKLTCTSLRFSYSKKLNLHVSPRQNWQGRTDRNHKVRFQILPPFLSPQPKKICFRIQWQNHSDFTSAFKTLLIQLLLNTVWKCVSKIDH